MFDKRRNATKFHEGQDAIGINDSLGLEWTPHTEEVKEDGVEDV